MTQERNIHISCRIPKALVNEINQYKKMGVTSSRGETISLLLEAGLQVMKPKFEDLVSAAKVLSAAKRQVLDGPDDSTGPDMQETGLDVVT